MSWGGSRVEAMFPEAPAGRSDPVLEVLTWLFIPPVRLLYGVLVRLGAARPADPTGVDQFER